MSFYDYTSAGSQDTCDTLEVFDATYPTWDYTQNQFNSPMSHEQNHIESLDQYPRQWPSTDAIHQPFSASQHVSALRFPSAPASYSSSHNSTFSYVPSRDSMSSSVSGHSHTSTMSRNQHFAIAEHLLSHGPIQVSSHAASPVEQFCVRPATRKENKKPAAPDRNYFKTCISATKQSRLCSKKHKYFCTSCERPFVEKADWKRHEETYQERPDMFKCDLCPSIYFLEKDFTKHHAQSHRCTSCAETSAHSKKDHARSARRRRRTRTGWGCGFCCHFSTDWIERCDHVARHIEKEGMTRANWYHSNVIYSLLQRPAVYHEWVRVLRARPNLTSFAWNQHSTGRVEGYPESNPTSQLQDNLEYFTPDQDAAALARLAYSKMVKPSTLPRTFTPPPVPMKDYSDTSLEDWVNEMESWAPLTNSVVGDDILPTGISRMEGWYAS